MQELRNRIVPSARAYRLDKLMDALDGHLRGPGVAPPPTTSKAAGEAAAQSVPVENGGGQSEGKSAGGEGMAAEGGAEAAASDEAGGVETIAGVVMVGGRGAGRRALIEYVMLAGVNDTEECGRELGELLKVRWRAGLTCVVEQSTCLPFLSQVVVVCRSTAVYK